MSSPSVSVSIGHKIQAASIAQAQLMAIEDRKNKANDRLVTMHQNIVNGKQELIRAHHWLIGLTSQTDPIRGTRLLQKLERLNDDLAAALVDLTQVEQRYRRCR